MIVTNVVSMTDSRSQKCHMHKTIVKGSNLFLEDEDEEQEERVQGFKMTNHY